MTSRSDPLPSSAVETAAATAESVDRAGDTLPAERDDADVRRMSLALFLAGFATFSLIYCVQPLLPEFSRDFGVTPAASSLAVSLTTGLLAVSIVIAGMASETFGRRGLMFVSMSGAALLNLLASLLPSWQALLAARAGVGLVLGGVPAVAMAYLSEEVPHRRLGKVMGLYVGGTAFGGMVGRVAIGVLTEFLSWRAAMATLSVVAVLSAIAFVLLLPPSRRFERRTGFDLAYHARAFRGHLADAALRRCFLTGFLAMGAFVTVYNYAGYRLSAAPYDLGQTQIGLIFLAYVFGIFASSLAGSLVDRLGRSRVTTCGALVIVAGLALTATSSLAVIVAGICVITVGFFMVHSVASGSVGRLARGHKGHASSLYLLSYYVGSALLGSLGGSVWHAGGWAGVVVFAVALALGVLVIALAPARQPTPVA